MKILLIDTCGPTGSVAFAAASKIIATATLPGRTASERLVPTIRDLATQAGLSLQSLGAVAVVHGPGSFTGVRVGLSAAKGLCQALEVPLVAVSRLAVLAQLAHSTCVHAVLDAGRNEFYHGEYLDGICIRESLLTRVQLLAALSNESTPILVACEPSVAESLASFSPRLLAEPTADDAVPLALTRIQLNDFDDPAVLDANYLRRTDAEIFAKPRPPAATHQPGTAVR